MTTQKQKTTQRRMTVETKDELRVKLSYLFNRSERLYWALKENRLDDAKEISDDMATQLGLGEHYMFGKTYKELARKKLAKELATIYGDITSDD